MGPSIQKAQSIQAGSSSITLYAVADVDTAHEAIMPVNHQHLLMHAAAKIKVFAF